MLNEEALCLPMTHSISERNLRKKAIERKKWLFAGSEDSAVANTVADHREARDQLRRACAPIRVLLRWWLSAQATSCSAPGEPPVSSSPSPEQLS